MYFLVQALAIQQKLGYMHPDTILSREQTAVLASGQGLYDEAERLLRLSLDSYKRFMGERHSRTLRSMVNHLELVLFPQRRWAKAQDVAEAALVLHRDVLGDRHPETLNVVHRLSIARHGLGRRQDALEMMQKCLLVQRQVLGEGHPMTLESAGLVTTWANDTTRDDSIDETTPSTTSADQEPKGEMAESSNNNSLSKAVEDEDSTPVGA